MFAAGMAAGAAACFREPETLDVDRGWGPVKGGHTAPPPYTATCREAAERAAPSRPRARQGETTKGRAAVFFSDTRGGARQRESSPRTRSAPRPRGNLALPR